jgi:hypothetical protein
LCMFRELLLRNCVEIAEYPLVLSESRHILHRRGDFAGQGSTLLHDVGRHIYEIDVILIGEP